MGPQFLFCSAMLVGTILTHPEVATIFVATWLGALFLRWIL